MAWALDMVQDSRIDGPHDFCDRQRSTIDCGKTLQYRLGFRIKLTGSFSLETDEIMKLGAIFPLK